MLSLFGVAGSGLHTSKVFLDATADNIANLNTMAPTSGPAYQARRVVAEPISGNGTDPAGIGQGVQVAGVVFGDPNGRLVYSPDNAVADAQGYVRAPDMDMGDEMVNMTIAQRAYEANLSVVNTAKETYEQAISIAH